MTDRKDELFSAIAVAVLLIGTASGSAITMMVLSTIVLLLGLLFFRPSMGAGPMLVMVVAAITAIVIAAAVALVRW